MISKVRVSQYSHRQLRRLSRARRKGLSETLQRFLPLALREARFVKPEEPLQELRIPSDLPIVPRMGEMIEGYARSLPNPIRPSDGAPPVNLDNLMFETVILRQDLFPRSWFGSVRSQLGLADLLLRRPDIASLYSKYLKLC